MRRGRHGAWPGWLLLAAAAAGATPAEDRVPPLPEVIERTETRLAQIDVTVSGPAAVLADLRADDFKVKVNFNPIVDFELDRFCDAASQTVGTPASAAAAPSFVFYFDQPHLTLAGRARSLDVAADLVRRLIRAGGRGMIVSNADSLSIVEEFTDDPERLLAGLERLENDRRQWDTYAETEDARVASVIDLLNTEGERQRALSMARRHQIEEVTRTSKNMGRFALTLELLAGIAPPKAVIYFADTLRALPGNHYMSFFGRSDAVNRSLVNAASTDSRAGSLSFDRAINQAAALNVRIYPVHAEGLVVPLDPEQPGSDAMGITRSGPEISKRRFRDAQQTLSNMAAETGGAVFLYGVPSDKIADQIVRDTSCIFLISFDPGDLRQDAPLRVKVELRRDDAQVHSRGRIVVQSEQARTTARLLGAFALPPDDKSGFGVLASLVPLGYARGRYSALLQVSVPGTNLPASTWELGASLVLRDRVVAEASGRLAVAEPGRPLILEREIELAPGAYEIVAVAHETTTDFILSDRAELTWPDPDDQSVACGPLVLFQPENAAFVRSGLSRSTGSRAYAPSEPLLPDRPTALFALVCRGRGNAAELTVRRSLVGETRVELDALEVDLRVERCAQVRDLFPAGTLGAGSYRYELVILQHGSPTAEIGREFVVLPGPGS